MVRPDHPQRHIRREAEAAIAKIGGTVYDFDRFDNVSKVEFIAPSSTVPDAALADFGRLTQLQVLVLSDSNVSDAGMAHLTGLTKLSELRLNGSQVTDVGLAHLEEADRTPYPRPFQHSSHRCRAGASEGVDQTPRARPSDTQVTDAGLVHLRGLTVLSHLKLSNTRVTDAGLFHLKGLTELLALTFPTLRSPMPSVLGGHHAGVDHYLDDRVVAGQLLELAIAEQGRHKSPACTINRSVATLKAIVRVVPIP